ncbi:unnamed protein product [Citrullus colocynthis]|uniref:Desiccation-related protein PCC13-62-like n=1 Tax=Citrullus colocynthis TaxID=252529 RepID=A0ABP0XT39_9ROSI
MVAPDVEVFRFASNFEYLEGEFYLNSALGRGIDSINPSLAFGGPPPIGAQKANLDPIYANIFEEFGYKEIGQLRAVIEAVGGRDIKRPLLNLSKEVFSYMIDKAVGFKLSSRFDSYANSINFLITASVFPYAGLVGLVGATPLLLFIQSRKRLDRVVLYEHCCTKGPTIVVPYNLTVAEFTNLTSTLANQLGRCGLKDEGIIVPQSSLRVENQTESNILVADVSSLSYSRIVQEILRILYGTSSENMSGAFFSEGANGLIARSLLGL